MTRQTAGSDCDWCCKIIPFLECITQLWITDLFKMVSFQMHYYQKMPNTHMMTQMNSCMAFEERIRQVSILDINNLKQAKHRCTRGTNKIKKKF